jgi:hypothetical protein
MIPQSQRNGNIDEDEMRVETEMPSHRRYFQVEKDDSILSSRTGMGNAYEEGSNMNNPRPIFSKFDFSFNDIMVGKKPGKRSHREMMMSSTTSSVVRGQLVNKR